MPIKCFLIEPTGNVFSETIRTEHGQCPRNGSYHWANRILKRSVLPPDGKHPERNINWDDLTLWPAKCECGFEFTPDSSRSTGGGSEYRRSDTGEVKDRLRDFPAGAMWRATWYKSAAGLYGHDWDNATEPPLIVCTPGGSWNIDSRASNCTMPNDRTHRCWIRHGVPPEITVDKSGFTCQAGAGSIQCGNYHGFLQNGYLT